MTKRYWAPWQDTANMDKDSGLCDSSGNDMTIGEAIEEHNAIAAERDDLKEALRHVFSLGSTCREVMTCGCGTCQRTRVALKKAGFTFDPPSDYPLQCYAHQLAKVSNERDDAIGREQSAKQLLERANQMVDTAQEATAEALRQRDFAEAKLKQAESERDLEHGIRLHQREENNDLYERLTQAVEAANTYLNMYRRGEGQVYCQCEACLKLEAVLAANPDIVKEIEAKRQQNDRPRVADDNQPTDTGGLPMT